MKITVISHSFPSLENTVQAKFVHDQVSLFSGDNDIDIKVLVPTPWAFPFTSRFKKNTSELISSNSERVFYLSFPAKRYPKIIQKSLSINLYKSLQNQSKSSLLHFHWLYPDAIAIPELSRVGFKTILTIHGSDWYQNYNQDKFKSIIKEIFESVNWVLFSGPKLRSDVLKIHPSLSKKSTVIYNFADSKLYKTPSKEIKNKAKKNLAWDTKKIHLLTVANIRHEKGIDILIDAIKLIQRAEKIKLHIIGHHNENDEYVKNIFSVIKSNDLHHVEILPPVSPNDLIMYYNAADLFVLPSRREGFNVSILEASACGLPVIATDVGGNFEIINEKNGALIPIENPELLARALDKLITNIEDYDSKAISKMTLNRFSEKSFKKNLTIIYESISTL